MVAEPAGAAPPAWPEPDRWPPVAVVVPARDEEAMLGECLEAVLAQDYPGQLEVVVAVAPSDDATERIAGRFVERDDRVRVVANRRGLTPVGLNLAVGSTDASVIARVDAHAVVPPGYLRRAVAALEATGAVNVGGVQRARGRTPTEQAVARAMSTPFGVGDARFHYGGEAGPVDTAYLGVFRRRALAAVGGFDERIARSQDAELNHRLRAAGGQVWLDPGLEVAYRPRGTLRDLARQYWASGRWKRAVVREQPTALRARQLAPPAAVVAGAAGLALAAAGRRWGLVAPVGYAAATVVASALTARGLPPRAAARLPAVYATMHWAWGVGFLTSPRRLLARTER